MNIFDSNPGAKLVSITPSDSTDLSSLGIRGLWVGGAGNIAVVAGNDAAAVTLVGVPAGTLIPIKPKKIMSTNTTATDIVGII